MRGRLAALRSAIGFYLRHPRYLRHAWSIERDLWRLDREEKRR